MVLDRCKAPQKLAFQAVLASPFGPFAAKNNCLIRNLLMRIAAPDPAVLIDIADRTLAERVALALDEASMRVTSVAAPPAEMHPDVVVSTRANALADLNLSFAGAADVGLLLLGASDPVADVCLPADFTDRELALGCRLLAQLVEWRRKALHIAATGRELERLAHTDALTQVANRRAWDLELPRRLQDAAAAGQAVAMAVFDVDHFKPVNDDLGHTAGDMVLSAVGRGLADSLRADDFVARLGGDEFGLLLVGSFDADAALRIVERVRKYAMSGLASFIPSPVSITAGCTAIEGGATAEVADLFAAADAALREAKQAGRDRTRMKPIA
jgi:diguanylate cyclase (GGDEF)-like protein